MDQWLYCLQSIAIMPQALTGVNQGGLGGVAGVAGEPGSIGFHTLYGLISRHVTRHSISIDATDYCYKNSLEDRRVV